MTETRLQPHTHPENDVRPDRSAWLAAGWAVLAGGLALIWAITGSGYPFGVNDPDGAPSLLRLLPPGTGAPVFAVVLLLTATALLAMATNHGVRLRKPLLAFGWVVAAALLIVVPDVEVLTVAGYAPMMIVGLPFGWPPVDYSTIFTFELLMKVLAMGGGWLIARALLRWQRRTAGSCVECGRGDRPAAWTSPESAAQWGRWAVYVAATIPVSYALVRYAWLAGIPLGITPEFLDELWESGLVWAGAGLATFGVIGAVLTFGLVQRWGEVFPRWMIGLAGRRVPIRLATIPATFVAIAVTAGSIAILMSAGDMAGLVDGFSLTTLPMLLWPFWGAALGAATVAYHLRRRDRCTSCGRR